MTKITDFPIEIQEEIKRTLGAYDKCHVVYANGKYSVQTGYLLAKEYPQDYKVYEDIHKNDILTKNERIEAYANNFHSYSNEYEGVQQYGIFANCTYADRFKIDENGNLIKL